MFGINVVDVVLQNHITSSDTLPYTLLSIAVSVSTLGKFFIQRISIIRFGTEFIDRLEKDLTRLVFSLCMILIVILFSPYIKIEISLIFSFMTLLYLSLVMINVPASFTILLADKLASS